MAEVAPKVDTLLAHAGPEGATPLRVNVYRRLARRNLRSVVANAFVVTREILGADGFDRLVADFLADGGAGTSLYRDVPGDMVAWAQRVEAPYADLMEYEWLELLAARHPADLDALFAEPPRAGLHVNPTLQVGVYHRPVHVMGPQHPDPPADPVPSAYLVWRRPESDAVCFQRVGLLIGRALSYVAAAPGLTRDRLAERLRLAAPDLSAATVRQKLDVAFDELASRDGLL